MFFVVVWCVFRPLLSNIPTQPQKISSKSSPFPSRSTLVVLSRASSKCSTAICDLWKSSFSPVQRHAWKKAHKNMNISEHVPFLWWRKCMEFWKFLAWNVSHLLVPQPKEDDWHFRLRKYCARINVRWAGPTSELKQKDKTRLGHGRLNTYIRICLGVFDSEQAGNQHAWPWSSSWSLLAAFTGPGSVSSWTFERIAHSSGSESGCRRWWRRGCPAGMWTRCSLSE